MRNLYLFPELRGLIRPKYWKGRLPQRYIVVKRPIPILKPLMIRRIRKPIHRRLLTGIEIAHLKRIPQRFGIESDLFDFHAHLDRSLSYIEAKTEIERKVRDIAPMKIEFPSTKHEILWYRAGAGDIKAQAEIGKSTQRR